MVSNEVIDEMSMWKQLANFIVHVLRMLHSSLKFPH